MKNESGSREAACRRSQAVQLQEHAKSVRQCNDRGMQNESGTAVTGACRMRQAVGQQHAE